MGALLLGLIVAGLLIRRDWRRARRGMPVRVWCFRYPLYPDDPLYDSVVVEFVKPAVVLFFVMAGLTGAVIWRVVVGV